MKFKSFLAAHKSLIKDVATSTCLLGASAGIVFGVSAGMFHIEYMDLNSPEARLYAAKNNAYTSEAISSQWNMNPVVDKDGNVTMPGVDMIALGIKQNMTSLEDWTKWHPGAETAPFLKKAQLQYDVQEGKDISNDAIKARFDYTAMVIDGATHSTMDRSFNQSLYEGLANFVKNKALTSYDPENLDPLSKNTANSYKPSQDNTTEFVNQYVSVIGTSDVVGLAGFNHSTPLLSLMQHAEKSDKTLDPFASATGDINKLTQKTGFILLDSNIANNQNIASVQFRADQPGFLAALATCEYFVNNLDIYHDNFQDLVVAEFGGVAIPTVMVYMGGFQRGIEFWNYILKQFVFVDGAKQYFGLSSNANTQNFKTFKILLDHSKNKAEIEKLPKTESGYGTFVSDWANELYKEYSVKIIKLGDIASHFSGTFAAGDAVGITKQYLNRGAQAIIAVAGPQSLDAAQEIQNQNSKCIVIGVDSAMEDGDYQRAHSGFEVGKEYNDKDEYVDKYVAPDGSYSAQSNSIIKFSAIKDIKTVSNKITRLIMNGQNWDISARDQNGNELEVPDPERAICGPGFQTCCNIKNGLISISWDGFYPLIEALRHITFDNGIMQYDFDTAWAAAVENYRKFLGETAWNALDKEYTDGITNYAEHLLTYKRTKENGEPTVWYKNYSHTIGILGMVLDRNDVCFDRTITLKITTDGYQMLAEGEVMRCPILEWLETNMYLTC